jgi:uncharacterized repeat protein (TIGR03837 family)
MGGCRSWDIFCTVIDNYGDAGVSWRLARQLAQEYGHTVRLWVDRLEVLARLTPQLDAARASQQVAGVEVCHWPSPFPEVVPHDGVIEAFGCTLPETFLVAMARRSPRPLWINLEYLSAEAWVPQHHLLASPHPRLPLTKYFFFPGFGAHTGGLLRERDLTRQRAAFQADPAAQAAFWQRWGVGPARPGERRISLFAYENAAVAELLHVLAHSPRPVTCLTPEGRLLPQVAAALMLPLAPGQAVERGMLRVQVLPFLPQDEYDRLLWACDFNFVRGEDSFVRAQWAARPFAWHIYPQEDGAHWRKLEAFTAVYVSGLPPQAANALSALWQAWNRQTGVREAWQACEAHWESLAHHAAAWEKHLAGQPDLASLLVQFCGKML